jgi:hypothetical protein
LGHIRLGRLPATKPWNKVVELLRAGSDVGVLADETAKAAEDELQSSGGDPILAYTVWLLTQLPLAARSNQYREKLVGLGFDAGAEESVLSLVAGFSRAVNRNVSGRSNRTDLGELALQAAAESLSKLMSGGTASLFGTGAEDVRRELRRLATKDRFAALAREFFARLTQKTLEYYISRELPNHVGPDRSILSIEGQIAFRSALEKHCREASEIVETFAGGWYSKSNFQGTLNPSTVQNFTDYALKKMRNELRIRRSANA